MIPLLPLLAGAVLAADFPADTLLPLRRVETHVATQAVEEEIRYDYARDSRGRLYETKAWTYADRTETRVDVTVTDREGRYQGGSLKRSSSPLITFEPVYGREGRMDRRILRMDGFMAVENYRYDTLGNPVEKLTLSAGDTTDWEFYPHTYDAEGRIATRKDYDRDSLNSTQVFRYDAQGRLAALIEYGNPWTLQDSAVFEYRPDGRVHRELHYGRFDGGPTEIVAWEYRVWQVPLSLARPAQPARRYPASYLAGAASDPLGRKARFTRVRAHGGIPAFPRP